jgi:predicted NBD/HSP70 family sugar kinase
VPHIPLYVINDAELAALGALSYKPLAAFGKILVLTLGYGIGAALIDRSPRTQG